MNNEKTISILRKCVNVLQGNYQSKTECKKDIETLLNEIDEYHQELTGDKIVQRENVTEALSNGLYSSRKRINYRTGETNFL